MPYTGSYIHSRIHESAAVGAINMLQGASSLVRRALLLAALGLSAASSSALVGRKGANCFLDTSDHGRYDLSKLTLADE